MKIQFKIKKEVNFKNSKVLAHKQMKKKVRHHMNSNSVK